MPPPDSLARTRPAENGAAGWPWESVPPAPPAGFAFPRRSSHRCAPTGADPAIEHARGEGDNGNQRGRQDAVGYVQDADRGRAHGRTERRLLRGARRLRSSPSPAHSRRPARPSMCRASWGRPMRSRAKGRRSDRLRVGQRRVRDEGLGRGHGHRRYHRHAGGRQRRVRAGYGAHPRRPAASGSASGRRGSPWSSTTARSPPSTWKRTRRR